MKNSIEIAKLIEKAGVPVISLHGLRHSFANMAFHETGLDVKALQAKLGHKDVKTTLEVYVHDDLELQRRKVEELSRLLHQKKTC